MGCQCSAGTCMASLLGATPSTTNPNKSAARCAVMAGYEGYTFGVHHLGTLLKALQESQAYMLVGENSFGMSEHEDGRCLKRFQCLSENERKDRVWA
ncbi:hypothetical protein M011DRAFT_33553 [Sporormia fimetaria CBS 119925]|uniref:Uncharacterized protein n=1 Tax=Sporormia fimetaria CBS 119925 TaxID=1340428 RepID=A0A6A6VEB7_9PLEO|nr:hypothetical protein M011DRAFT_33553 [Sporormia fimetaria CBS 119925]